MKEAQADPFRLPAQFLMQRNMQQSRDINDRSYQTVVGQTLSPQNNVASHLVSLGKGLEIPDPRVIELEEEGNSQTPHYDLVFEETEPIGYSVNSNPLTLKEYDDDALGVYNTRSGAKRRKNDEPEEEGSPPPAIEGKTRRKRTPTKKMGVKKELSIVRGLIGKPQPDVNQMLANTMISLPIIYSENILMISA